MRTRSRLTVVLFFCFSFWLEAGAVELGKQVQFDIPPQPLSAALIQFSKQAEVQVMASGQKLEGVITKGLRGRRSIEEGLRLLLDDTGLRFRVSGPNTILLGPVPTAEQRPPQASDADGVERGELITVTAQKREERAFDVPISIVAIGAEELQRRNVTGIDDLGTGGVPGLTVRSSSTYQRQITLRGISNVFGNSSLIGLYLDEMPVTTNPFDQLDLKTYDLDRVEVLRGPQGTLYGEGSVGGTIRFITKDPVFNRFAMRSDVAAMFTQDGTPGQRIQAAVNVPVVDNELALRVAATFEHLGGWIEQPAAGREDFNDQNLSNIRLKALWRPNSRYSLNSMAVAHRNDAPPSTGEDAEGNYRQTFNLTTTPDASDNYDIYGITQTLEFDWAQLVSATSYIRQDKTLTAQGFRFPLIAPPAAAFDLYNPTRSSLGKIFNQELRLSSVGPGPWQWTLGGFYRDSEIDHARTQHFGLPVAAGAPLPALVAIEDHTLSKSWAIFGDVNYKFTDRLTLGVGLRYFEEDQEFVAGTNGVLTTQTGSFDSLNPRAYAQYYVNDNLNVYGSAAKGFRSGGFNNLNQPSYGPEEVWTYELGTKLSSRRFSAEVALFYSDYTNYQISGILPPPAPILPIISNSGSIRMLGVELALLWRPIDLWTVSFSGNHVDSEFYKIDNIIPSSQRFFVGDRPDLFPNYQFAFGVQRDFDWAGRKGFARLDYSQQGRSIYRNRVRPWYFSYSDVIDMLNFNLSLQVNPNLTVGLFGQNLFNDRGYTDPFAIEENAARPRPRTFGIQFGLKFD